MVDYKLRFVLNMLLKRSYFIFTSVLKQQYFFIADLNRQTKALFIKSFNVIIIFSFQSNIIMMKHKHM